MSRNSFAARKKTLLLLLTRTIVFSIITECHYNTHSISLYSAVTFQASLQIKRCENVVLCLCQIAFCMLLYYDNIYLMTYIADDFNATVASHAGMSSQKIASMVKRRLLCIVRSNIRPAYLWIQLFKSRQSVLEATVIWFWRHLLKMWKKTSTCRIDCSVFLITTVYVS